MAGTLIISEKNKAAQAIAEALGPVNTIRYGKRVKIYHVPSQEIYVVPLRGHIRPLTLPGTQRPARERIHLQDCAIAKTAPTMSPIFMWT